MQAALLCQILQHSQLQAQHHQQEQRLQRARQAAGQAEVPRTSRHQPASTGSLQDDIDQRAGAWRAPSQGAGSSGPDAVAGHSRDLCQHMSTEQGRTGSGSLASSRPACDITAANMSHYSSAAAPARPSRAGRSQSSFAGSVPARHAEMLPAHVTVLSYSNGVPCMADACYISCTDARISCKVELRRKIQAKFVQVLHLPLALC